MILPDPESDTIAESGESGAACGCRPRFAITHVVGSPKQTAADRPNPSSSRADWAPRQPGGNHPLISPVFDPPGGSDFIRGTPRVPTPSGRRRAQDGSRQPKAPAQRVALTRRSTVASPALTDVHSTQRRVCGKRTSALPRTAAVLGRVKGRSLRSLFALDPPCARRRSWRGRDAGRPLSKFDLRRGRTQGYDFGEPAGIAE